MAHCSEQLTAQTTAHGMAHQTVQKMGRWTVHCSEMQMAQQMVQRMVQQMAHRSEQCPVRRPIF